MFEINTILFDLFHTLVDVATAPDSSGRYTADIIGVDREAWNRACFSDLHDICRLTEHLDTVRTLAHSLDPTIPEALIVEAVVERESRFEHALTHVEAETLGLLAGLRERGMRLVLVSNASTGEVAAWSRSPLAALFDAAVFSCECGMRKPERGIYRHALRQVGAEAQRALFVGDGGSDEHRGARAAGLATVLTSRWVAPAEVARRRALADHHVNHLRELPGLLRRLPVPA